ncbi:autoinducer binding domain-containing protein [Nitrospirillum sp. BR 11164]|uniref:helix-turn-helix transcriptional regulator n=1 Tax=Nitrospirillum sp. BR 11164 TaxID=3104324 RepID=UPI002AFFA378|nr:autoinducer binding domain-containing protein [Nitrospirillum sp. BR 11164]MEA1647771.1 autoinducer binding domain-containing protein [Nitrospirillum sp. BR 11164]
MILDEALNRLGQPDNPEDLFNTFSQLARDLGYAAVSYIDSRPGPAPGEPDLFVRTTVREDFLHTYLSEGYMSHDPLMVMAKRQAAPLTWADVPEFHASLQAPSKLDLPARGRAKQDAQRAIAVMTSAADHGYTQGYVIPTHTVDPQGRLASAVVSLFWTQKPEGLISPDSAPAWLRLSALYFHERVVSMRLTPVTPPPTLTQREQEALVWASRGKTVEETGEIIGVSGRTVTFHLQNALEKLGCYSKIHAVAKAIQMGLIHP